MSKIKSAAVSVGLGLLVLTAPAKADIRVTLTSGTSSVTETSTGTATPNQFTGLFSVGNYNLEIVTAFTTPPVGSGGVGYLSSNANIISTTGIAGSLANLTVTVQDVDSMGNLISFGSPSSYNVLNSASASATTPTTLTLRGSEKMDAAHASVAPVTLNLVNSPTGVGSNTQTVTTVSGYNLAQTYTLSGLSARSSGLTIGFTTSVTPAAVPEPSSLVLTGLTALGLGLGGLAYRRRPGRPGI